MPAVQIAIPIAQDVERFEQESTVTTGGIEESQPGPIEAAGIRTQGWAAWVRRAPDGKLVAADRAGSGALTVDGQPVAPSTETITPEFACTITWLLPTFGVTVVKTVAAGEEVPAQWGAFSCNIANSFLLKIRGL